jgi:hypothetical protein
LCKGIFKFAILNHKYYNKVFRNNYWKIITNITIKKMYYNT